MYDGGRDSTVSSWNSPYVGWVSTVRDPSTRTSGSGSTAPSLIHHPGRVTRSQTRSAGASMSMLRSIRSRGSMSVAVGSTGLLLCSRRRLLQPNVCTLGILDATPLLHWGAPTEKFLQI